MPTTTMRFRKTVLVQLNADSARWMFRDWNRGEDFYYPAVSRHTDDIELDDLVLFWVSGPSDTAGVVGFGIATGDLPQLEHPVSYRNPDGPTTLRDSAEVAVAWVSDKAVLTRSELARHAAFTEFELFKMPNRPNAFAVTDEQSAVVLDRLKSVLG